MVQFVYVTRKFPDEALSILTESKKLNVKSWPTENVIPREDLLLKVKGVNGLVCTISDVIDQEVLDAAGPQLKTISTMSAGTEHINMRLCKERGIEVTKVADVASDSAAEFTVTLVLLVARRLLEGMDAVINGEWGLWKPMWICGFEMSGKTLGIYGFGRVGFGVARRLRPFGIQRIIYNDISVGPYAETVRAEQVNFSRLMAESDILCVCCAATPLTIKSINKESLAMMKEESILINTSRGLIVDHIALNDALKFGRPMAAGLDVTEPEPLPVSHPLMSNPKCIITPHLGTSVLKTRVKMAEETVKNLYTQMLGRD